MKRAEQRGQNTARTAVLAVTSSPPPPALPPETDKLVFKPSCIHGVGGFAKMDLVQGTLVIEYVGERISAKESIRRCQAGNQFIFRLNENCHLDGNVDWNPARFLNHSCSPNCEAEFIDERIWLVALRDIVLDEEVTFDYGYDLEDFRAHRCRCGAPNCCGYILSEELRDSLPSP